MGNYWDDYEEIYPDAEEIDITGIWDTPYSIDRGEDNYPLMRPFENYIKPKTAFESAVEYAQPNYIRKALIRLEPISPPKYTPKPAGVPNDPFWDEQYNLGLINVDDAWKRDKGDKSIKIAIVDTGIQYEHPDLKSNYVSGGYDWVNDDSYPYDDHGHGTYCAGIAAAVMNNKKGIAGIAQVSLMAEKVLDENETGYDTDAARGIRHAVGEGAKIICLSLGGDFSSREKSACQDAWDSGCLLIAGSGNTGTRSIVYPAGYDTVIAVGAIDKNKRRWSDSNYGTGLELVAPGVDVISTHLDDGYAQGSGTSGAVPHVAGVAALLWSRCPSLTNQQIRDMLKESAIDLGASGWDEYYGYGMVNANVVYKIIYVPDDYTTIQGAVDAASHGDIIIVRDGVYTENIDVNKPLTIRSENGPTKCIVKATNPDDHVFEVTADCVNIRGFTINGATEEIGNGLHIYMHSDGIYLKYADYCNLSNNKCSYNKHGIYLYNSTNNSISNNNCSNNTEYGIYFRSSNNNTISDNNCSTFALFSTGIHLDTSTNNSISNNKCSGNLNGISLSDSYNNKLVGNILLENGWHGIFLSDSTNNKLTGNVMRENGIAIRGHSLSHYTHEIDASNTVNGKTVYYWKDVEGGRIPDGAGQVLLVNCSNINVENLNLNNASVGIKVAFSSFITIKNNNCFSNNRDGIYLYYSYNNSISNNNCSNNRNGIFLEYSNSNNIHLNNFVNNIDNVYAYKSANEWNSSVEINYTYNGSTRRNYLGNYWDDYVGTDADGDGIGDRSYDIKRDIQNKLFEIDNYPLMEPWEKYIYNLNFESF